MFIIITDFIDFIFLLHKLIHLHILRYFVRRANSVIIYIGFDIYNHYYHYYYHYQTQTYRTMILMMYRGAKIMT